MPIKVTLLKRLFRYSGMDIPDPHPDLSPAKVVEALSAAYPEFVTAKIEPPITEGEFQVFTVSPVVGEKG